MKRFEDIIAWQKSKVLAVLIYKKFYDNRDFGFKDQIQRAAISISNNIAEGFDRHTDKELRRYLFIAKGSCAETKSMLYIALELSYIDQDQFKNLYELTTEISKLLTVFIKKLTTED